MTTDRKPALSVTLDDCEVQTFRAGGPGGQKQNKTDSGVRVIHHPSGARGESREERSQLQNKRTAFTRMVKSDIFMRWVNRTLSTGPTPEERVAADLEAVNLRVEGKVDGKWVEIQ